MTTITLSDTLLMRLARLNQLSLPNVPLLFVGIRSAVPDVPGDNGFSASAGLHIAPVNYQNPCCTLVQWRLPTKEVAVFPASTVPYKTYIERSMLHGGAVLQRRMPGHNGIAQMPPTGRGRKYGPVEDVP